MSKLFEVLAVEESLFKASKKLIAESIKTFGKDNLFKGHTRRLEMFNADDQKLNTTNHLQLDTTVDENMDYLIPVICKHWNGVLKKDATNQTAIADLIMEDGTVLAKGLPATFLLGMETKLGELRKLYDAVPTLAPGIKWELNEMERAGVFLDVNDDIQFKTETDMDFKTAAEATEHHPAQIVQLKNTKNVGKYTTTSQSGMVTPLRKAQMIARFDEILVAVKKSRQRANSVQVVKTERVAESIFKFIQG